VKSATLHSHYVHFRVIHFDDFINASFRDEPRFFLNKSFILTIFDNSAKESLRFAFPALLFESGGIYEEERSGICDLQ
jgi:hypothetical protein